MTGSHDSSNDLLLTPSITSLNLISLCQISPPNIALLIAWGKQLPSSVVSIGKRPGSTFVDKAWTAILSTLPLHINCSTGFSTLGN